MEGVREKATLHWYFYSPCLNLMLLGRIQIASLNFEIVWRVSLMQFQWDHLQGSLQNEKRNLLFIILENVYTAIPEQRSIEPRPGLLSTGAVQPDKCQVYKVALVSCSLGSHLSGAVVRPSVLYLKILYSCWIAGRILYATADVIMYFPLTISYHFPYTSYRGKSHSNSINK